MSGSTGSRTASAVQSSSCPKSGIGSWAGTWRSYVLSTLLPRRPSRKSISWIPHRGPALVHLHAGPWQGPEPPRMIVSPCATGSLGRKVRTH